MSEPTMKFAIPKLHVFKGDVPAHGCLPFVRHDEEGGRVSILTIAIRLIATRLISASDQHGLI